MGSNDAHWLVTGGAAFAIALHAPPSAVVSLPPSLPPSRTTFEPPSWTTWPPPPSSPEVEPSSPVVLLPSTTGALSTDDPTSAVTTSEVDPSGGGVGEEVEEPP